MLEKMGGVLGNVLFPPRNWNLRIFYIKGGVLGGLFENTSPRHGGFFGPHLGPQVNVFGKVVNANQRLWLMRRLGYVFPG